MSEENYQQNLDANRQAAQRGSSQVHYDVRTLTHTPVITMLLVPRISHLVHEQNCSTIPAANSTHQGDDKPTSEQQYRCI